jgi:hypothetical protein
MRASPQRFACSDLVPDQPHIQLPGHRHVIAVQRRRLAEQALRVLRNAA